MACGQDQRVHRVFLSDGLEYARARTCTCNTDTHIHVYYDDDDGSDVVELFYMPVIKFLKVHIENGTVSTI